MSGVIVSHLGRRLLDYAVAGVVGTTILRAGGAGATKVQPALRRAAVGVVTGGIVLSRRLGTMTEEARLTAGDVVAEARKRLGEEATPPQTTTRASGHEHEH
ncbi:MAG: DUF1490 family protein [Egibacteraceae bacterium]